MSKIIKLSAKNVLRLSAVEITPEGELVVIGGNNAQGKTSVLDSILLALGGRVAKHTEPLKRGEEKGFATVELEDIVVTRTFTEGGGGSLKVTNKKGLIFSTPQKILDKLVSALSFDPLAWTAMDSKKQTETLRNLLDLDFDAADETRKVAYDERTAVKRMVRDLQGKLKDFPEIDENIEKVDTQELMSELDRRAEHNEENEQRRSDYAVLVDHGADLRRNINEMQERLGTLRDKAKTLKAEIDGLEDQDEEEIRTQIQNASETNERYREAKARRAFDENLKQETSRVEQLTQSIEAIDSMKGKALKAAKWPVKGLGMDGVGVTYNSIPFEQASSAEQLRVSVGMGIALNPELKVILIRDGSLLDDANLQMVADMAKESGHQIWLERVGKGKEVQVIIEDGMVETAETATEEGDC